MSIAVGTIDQITAEGLSTLLGAPPDPERIAFCSPWSRHEAAVAAASLANTKGGLVLIGIDADSTGVATAITGTGASAAELQSAIDDLGRAGRHLARFRTLHIDGKDVGVIFVAASLNPPVLVETHGTIYRRTAEGLTQVLSRSGLDELVAKDRAGREHAERQIQGMIDRVAFGHLNFMSLAMVLSPRATSDAPYRWAVENRASLFNAAFVRDSGLSAGDVSVRPGEILIAREGDETAFVRVSRNGSVAVGERCKRPPQAIYLPPADLSRRLSEIAGVAATIAAAAPGPILGALFLEGVRDLRLPVEGGTTSPAKKDLVCEFLPERYVEDPEDRAAIGRDLRLASGLVFDADLVNGTGKAVAAAPAASNAGAQNWRGQTKRTERRLAGLRGHGSAR